MQTSERLKELFNKQRLILKEYEQVIKEFESNDIVNQNKELLKEVQKLKSEALELSQRYQKIMDENQNLKTALNEQILDEKLNILKISKEKINTYFEDISNEYNNGLIAFEENSKQQINKLRAVASKELGEQKVEFENKVADLYIELQNKINEKRKHFIDEKQNIFADMQNASDLLQSQGVSEEIIQKRIKRNNIEVKIGLNLINKIGIFLILIGVAAFMKYGYNEWLSSHMKGFFAFVIGGIFLVAGELFNRRDKDVFAKGLTGGGIAILYYAIFNAYFIFKIVNIEAGIILSLLVTLTALVLSLYHNSITICAFSLIGGYLPFFAYAFKLGLDASGMYLAMGYLFILNLLILIISMNKRWNVANYISFLLNVPTLIYLVFAVPSNTVGIIYSIFTFSMYLAITLIYPFRNKVSLKIPDIILLALNTFISCIVIYSLFERAELQYLNGFLALLFALIYFGLGQFITKYMEKEKFTQVLFYLTSLTFAVLMIPFQFGVQWAAMGWFVEGSLMIVYGYKNKFKELEGAGWGIFLLCIFTFFFVDVVNNAIGISSKHQYFDFKYLTITLGSIGILFMYLLDMNKNVLQKYSNKGRAITVFKYFTLVNFWIYITYTSNKLYDKYVHLHALDDFYRFTLFAVMTILVGFIISNMSLLKDTFVKYFSIFLYIIGDLICIALTLDQPILKEINNTTLQYFGFIILLLFNIFVFFNIRFLVINIIQEHKKNLEFYPLLMSIYLIGSLTGFLMVQFSLEKINLMFSLIYIALAFLCIAYGFKQKYVMIRRFGLGLSVFATAKLFIYDLSYLNNVGRIIAYFCFGIIMLAISLLYQKVSNAIDKKSVSL